MWECPCWTETYLQPWALVPVRWMSCSLLEHSTAPQDNTKDIYYPYTPHCWLWSALGAWLENSQSFQGYLKKPTHIFHCQSLQVHEPHDRNLYICGIWLGFFVVFFFWQNVLGFFSQSIDSPFTDCNHFILSYSTSNIPSPLIKQPATRGFKSYFNSIHTHTHIQWNRPLAICLTNFQSH